MAEKWVKAFTEDDVDRWHGIAVRHMPAPPKNSDLILAPEVQSYSCKALPTLIAVNFALDNGKNVVINLNPFIVQTLMKDFSYFGQTGKWLNSAGEITFPYIVNR